MRSNEDGLPSAAIRFAVDHGLSRDGAPSLEEGGPMECYVGLDVHGKESVFVIQDGCGQVRGQGEVPTTPAEVRLHRTREGHVPDRPALHGARCQSRWLLRPRTTGRWPPGGARISISGHVAAAHAASRGRYGSPRVYRELQAQHRRPGVREGSGSDDRAHRRGD